MNHRTSRHRQLPSMLLILSFVALASLLLGTSNARAIAAGDISIDHLAAGPGTYNHETGAPLDGANFGYNDRTISKTAGVVESLEGGDFECGDRVVFLQGINVDADTRNTATGELTLTTSFNQFTTSGGAIGFTSVEDVELLTGDGAYFNSGPVLTLAWTETSTSTQTFANITLGGLDPGDFIVVAYTVILECRNLEPVTGNIQSAVEFGKVNNKAIQLGQQTVPLKSAGDIGDPAIEISKSCPTTPSGARVGDEITYSVTIRNTGTAALSNIVVTDDRSGTFSPAFPTTLAVGASATSTFTSIITAADAAGANVDNTARVSADDIASRTVTDSVTATCPFTPFAALEIVKTADKATVSTAGETIAYEYLVTNTGDIALTGVVVTDDRETVTCPATELAVGASMTCTAAHVVTQAELDSGADLVNVGTADSDQTGPDTDDETVTVTQTPALDLAKACPVLVGGERVGAAISYDVTVTNTGNVTLTRIVLTDDRAGAFSDGDATTEGDDTVASLAPGATATRTFTSTITYADADGTNVDNTASATATNFAAATDDATATCPFTPFAALEITKTANTVLVAAVGTVVTYTYLVENTGDIALTGVTVTDDRLGAITCPTDTIAVGGSLTCTATYTVTQADLDAGDDIVNIGTADSNETGPDTDDATVTPVQAPGIDILKSADPTSVSVAGTVVTYSYLVSNTGNVTLTGVSVSDDRLGPITCPATELAVSANMTCTATYTVTQADLDSGAAIVNVATITSNQTPPDTDDETVAVVQTPSVGIWISCPATTISPIAGTMVTYAVTVTNTGNVTLTNVSVTSPRSGTFSIALPTNLAVGGTVNFTFTTALTGAEIASGNISTTVNVATEYLAAVNSATATCPVVAAATVTPSQPSAEVTGPFNIALDSTRTIVTGTFVVADAGDSDGINVVRQSIAIQAKQGRNFVGLTISSCTFTPTVTYYVPEGQPTTVSFSCTLAQPVATGVKELRIFASINIADREKTYTNTSSGKI